MFGKYWVPSREHMLSPMKVAFLAEAMSKKYEIIIDDMNLNPKTIKWYEDYVKYHNATNGDNKYEIEYRKMNTPLEVCLERDSKRENPVGAGVIVSTYNRYKETLESWNE
jgi:predicted kinase